MRRLLACLLTALWVLPAAAQPAPQPIPRTIVALYDSREFPNPEQSLLHRFAEMPLNHLGLKVTYVDITKDGLPDLSDRPDVRGVLTWFRNLDAAYPLPDPAGYLRWADKTMHQGKKFVVLGGAGFVTHLETSPQLRDAAAPFLADLGLRYTPCSFVEMKLEHLLFLLHLREYSPCMITHTAGTEFVTKDRAMVEFERPYGDTPPPYFPLKLIADSGAVSHLTVRRGGDASGDSALVVTGANGGFVDEEYAVHTHWDPVTKIDDRKWYIDPFTFFAAAYGTDDLPKPDTTTLDGERIFYHHIDGDGWTNMTHVKGYDPQKTISAGVILAEIIEPYPDLPVTVAAIGADMDMKWAGSEASRQVARELYALPQVEAATHTYSHPLDWVFFKEYTKEKERPFLARYGDGPNWGGVKFDPNANGPPMPREYAAEPFDLDKEISGAAAEVQALCPPGKQVAMLMFSGDASPYEAVARNVREAGLLNINGGDSRFDDTFPSYSWTAPIGREVGAERQIYSSDSNENTYAGVSDPPYDGFKQLIQTVERTESPIRIKPFNLYHHMFSGDYQGSLDVLKAHLAYARKSAVIPIETSQYAAIANGFYSAQFISLGKDQWEVRDRGALQTIRFDHADARHVDFARSRGVIGETHYQGSLYLALDDDVAVPIVALTDAAADAATPPYLLDSRWHIRHVQIDKQTIRFRAQGYGIGAIRWHVPNDGDYTIAIGAPGTKPETIGHATATSGVLEISLKENAITPVEVTLKAGGR